ncbi:MAG TPA: tetratricopeptide repeat protein, partial [Pyrinomonadaceae bacterium]|nr:tetratricopeptide repeat protein [Pyrinomonadaceae bacterium]
MKQFFKQFVVLFLVSSFAATGFAQTQPPKKKPAAANTTAKKPASPAKKPTPAKSTAAKPKPRPVATPTPVDPAVEKAKFDAAIAAATPAEKAELLLKFTAEFPKSEHKVRIQESLVGARAAMADERLTAGETEQGLRLFKLAISDAPKPYGDRMFNEIIARIPANLFFRGEQQPAIEIAQTIEMSVAGNPKQLLMLANFYLATENGAEAKRIAESVIKAEERNAAAYQTLAMAHRLNFDLEESAKAYAKSLELEPESASAKRSLAEMKRALGRSDEAVALYREVLAKDENDNVARTGLILSLFDNGKKAEAEADLARSLEKTPGNVFLLAGAAYWYAANNDGEKAVETARKAIEKEPRFIWSHIALGRGLMLQKKPVEAEQALIAARKYGNFPTLQYEIASARLAAGFFREAAEELHKSFVIEGGVVKTKLGGRVERGEKSFTEAIAFERRASIFAADGADSAEDADRLKALLELDQKLSVATPSEPEVIALAERFAHGDDNMNVHRKLYAANLLLQKKVGADKALEMARSATAG